MSMSESYSKGVPPVYKQNIRYAYQCGQCGKRYEGSQGMKQHLDHDFKYLGRNDIALESLV